MSTQLYVRRGGPSASTIQVLTTGLVAPLSPSTITTTSYVTPNGVMRVDRTVASGNAPRIASWR
jgi:mannitol-specific phosphotransferase system IIBC component